MDVDKVKELVELMKVNDLTELEILDGQLRVVLKRGVGQAMPHMVAMPGPMAGFGPVASPFPAAGGSAPAPAAAAAEPEEKSIEIKSPLVGTFYAAPSPNAEPFVKVGSAVDKDTVVCIVEAMKVMNEIKAQVNGTIKKVLVANGQAVEFGQPLFLVSPD